MNEFCECPIAGYCTRHNIVKGEARFKSCKGTGHSKDCGLAYWQAWERGELGATAPDDPQMNPTGFCSQETFTLGKTSTKSSIGTKMHEIIFRETGAEIPCAECRDRISMLNQMSPEQVEVARPEIVADIVARASKQAPKLWQRIALTIDKFLDTGLANVTVNGWLTEAIKAEANIDLSNQDYQPPKKKLDARPADR